MCVSELGQRVRAGAALRAMAGIDLRVTGGKGTVQNTKSCPALAKETFVPRIRIRVGKWLERRRIEGNQQPRDECRPQP